MENKMKMQIVTDRRGRKQIQIQHAKLRFVNLNGTRTQYNAAGDRNFVIDLTDEDPEIVQALEGEGFNISIKPGKGGNGGDAINLKVKAKYYVDENGNPSGSNPQVWWKSGNNPAYQIPVDSWKNVDDSFYDGQVDDVPLLVIYPKSWDSAIGSGTTARLSRMLVFQDEDWFTEAMDRMAQSEHPLDE